MRMPAFCDLAIHRRLALSIAERRSIMANKRSWDLQHRQKRLDYLFRAYVKPEGDAWHVRHELLHNLARACGEHYCWSETIHIGDHLERQVWMIFGFKEYERKLRFEVGLPAVLAVHIEPVEALPLPNGLADPNRDLSDLARRMARKGYGR
jgi:hypothetical protein